MDSNSDANPTQKSFVGSAKLLAVMTLASRILGMIRDMLAASVFGLTALWDAFSLAFLIPNMFRRLFGEGALTSAFVPVFVDHLEKQGKPAASRLLSALATGVVLILTLACAAGLAVTIVLPKFVPSSAPVCELASIMMPYMILICLTAVLAAALNSLNHFAAPALAQVVLNAALIATLLIVTGTAHHRIVIFSIAVVGAGVLQVLLQWAPLLRHGVGVRPSLDFAQPGVREVSRLFLPATLGVGLLQVNELVDKLIANIFVDAGGVSALYFSDRFTFFPLSMIGAALATAVFPTLARAASRDDREAFDGALSRGLRLALFLGIPAAVGLLMIPDLIVRVIYQHGEFDAVATTRTSRVLFFYSTGLVFYMCNHLFVRAFYARKDTATPFRIMGAMVAVNLGLNLVLVRTPLREAGIALATAITGMLNLALLTGVLRRKHGVRMMRGVAVTALKCLGIAGLMAALLWGARRAPTTDLIRLCLCVGGSITLTLGLGAAVCRAEVRDIVG